MPCATRCSRSFRAPDWSNSPTTSFFKKPTLMIKKLSFLAISAVSLAIFASGLVLTPLLLADAPTADTGPLLGLAITTTSLSAVLTGFRAVFLEAYQGVTDAWHKQLAMITESTGESEEYHWLGAVPGLRKLLGEVVVKNLVRHGYTIRNEEWEDTIGVKRKDIERDKLGIYNPLVASMGIAAAQHPDDLVAELMVGGFVNKDYTGSAFFAANKKAHANARAFSNKGTKKLSVANYETGRANIRARVNAEGRAMRLGRDLVLAVAPKNEALARTIVVSEKVGGGNDNVNKGTARPLVLPELTPLNEDAWFLFESGYPIKPFIVQHELRAETNMVTNPNDSHVVLNQEFLYQLYARHAAGYGLPELAYGSTGEDAA